MRRFLPWLLVLSVLAIRADRALAQSMSALPPQEKPLPQLSDELSLPPVPAGFEVVDTRLCEIAFRPEHRSAVGEVIEGCDRAVEELSDTLGENALPPGAVRVRIARNTDIMRELAPPDAPPPSWADAVAYPEIGLVLLSLVGTSGVSRPPLDVVLRHELCHLLLQRATAGVHLPRWFGEGVAIVESGEVSLERLQLLYKAILFGRLLPLREMNRNYPKREWAVTLAYAQAVELVASLVQRHGGWGPIRQLLKRVRNGVPFDRAFEQVYRDTPQAFAETWRQEMRKRLNIIPVITGTATLWTAMAALLVWGYVVRRQRNKKVLAAWEAEEAEHDAAIDRILSVLDHRSDPGDGEENPPGPTIH